MTIKKGTNKRLLEVEWKRFKQLSLPESASSAQEEALRIAYMAGAAGLLRVVRHNMNGTPNDFTLIPDVQQEIAEFVNRYKESDPFRT